jgi:hypothetical protein
MMQGKWPLFAGDDKHRYGIIVKNGPDETRRPLKWGFTACNPFSIV